LFPPEFSLEARSCLTNIVQKGNDSEALQVRIREWAIPSSRRF
jgi:hypothetical protein